MSQQSTHLLATDPPIGDEQPEHAHENTPARPKANAAWSLDDCFWKKSHSHNPGLLRASARQPIVSTSAATPNPHP